MKKIIFNSFKERLLNGQIKQETDVNVYAMGPDFIDTFKNDKIDLCQYRTLDDFYVFSHNNNTSGFYDTRFKYVAEHVTYSAHYSNDISEKPIFVNTENWESFCSVYGEVEGEVNLSRIKNLYVDGEGDGDFEERGSGFYYVRDQSQMKWLADRINDDSNFNNKLIIVLGDNIGMNTYKQELDFCICPTCERPFAGIFDLNSHYVQNLNIVCNTKTAGIIGYLGYNGVVRNGIVRDCSVQNNRKISIENIKTDCSDVCIGCLVGTNMGTVENIRLEGEFDFNGCVPEIYLTKNKTEYYAGASTVNSDGKTNVFFLNKFCANSPMNVIPYVGYFCEGCESQYEDDFGTAWIADGNKHDLKLNYIRHDSGVWYDQKHINSNFLDVSNLTRYNHHNEDYRQWSKESSGDDSYLWITYETPAGHTDWDEMYRVQCTSFGGGDWDDRVRYTGKKAFRDGLLCGQHILNSRGYGIKYQRKTINERMHPHARIAYYCSPLVGNNFGIIKDVNFSGTIVESKGTFVGFIGCITGRQSRGNISNVFSRYDIRECVTHVPEYKHYVKNDYFDPEMQFRAFGYDYDIKGHRERNEKTSEYLYNVVRCTPEYYSISEHLGEGTSGTNTNPFISWSAHNQAENEFENCYWHMNTSGSNKIPGVGIPDAIKKKFENMTVKFKMYDPSESDISATITNSINVMSYSATDYDKKDTDRCLHVDGKNMWVSIFDEENYNYVHSADVTSIFDFKDSTSYTATSGKNFAEGITPICGTFEMSSSAFFTSAEFVVGHFNLSYLTENFDSANDYYKSDKQFPAKEDVTEDSDETIYYQKNGAQTAVMDYMKAKITTAGGYYAGYNHDDETTELSKWIRNDLDADNDGNDVNFFREIKYNKLDNHSTATETDAGYLTAVPQIKSSMISIDFENEMNRKQNDLTIKNQDFIKEIKKRLNLNSIPDDEINCSFDNLYIPVFNNRRPKIGPAGSYTISANGKTYKVNGLSFTRKNKGISNLDRMFIHGKIEVPIIGKEYDSVAKTHKAAYNHNCCKLYKFILSVPVASVGIPISVTSVTANESVAQCSAMCATDFLEHTLHTDVPYKPIEVYNIVAAYNMDDTSYSDIQYKTQSIYNIGGIAGMVSLQHLDNDDPLYSIDGAVVHVPSSTTRYINSKHRSRLRSNASLYINDKNEFHEKNTTVDECSINVACKYAAVAPIIEMQNEDCPTRYGWYLPPVTWFDPSFPDYYTKISNKFANIQVIRDDIARYDNLHMQNASTYFIAENDRANRQYYSNFFNWMNVSLMPSMTKMPVFIGNWSSNDKFERSYIGQTLTNTTQCPAVYLNWISIIEKTDGEYKTYQDWAKDGLHMIEHNSRSENNCGHDNVHNVNFNHGLGVFQSMIMGNNGDWTCAQNAGENQKNCNNRAIAKFFQRHYERASKFFIAMNNCRAVKGKYEAKTHQLSYVFDKERCPEKGIGDIFMSPVMNIPIFDWVDVWQPMLTGSPNFVNTKLSRAVMRCSTIPQAFCDDNVPETKDFDSNNSTSLYETAITQNVVPRQDKSVTSYFYYDYEIKCGSEYPVKNNAADRDGRPTMTGIMNYVSNVDGNNVPHHYFTMKTNVPEGEEVVSYNEENTLKNDGSTFYLGNNPYRDFIPQSIIDHGGQVRYDIISSIDDDTLHGWLVTDTSGNNIMYCQPSTSVSITDGSLAQKFCNTVSGNDMKTVENVIIEVK